MLNDTERLWLMGLSAPLTTLNLANDGLYQSRVNWGEGKSIEEVVKGVGEAWDVYSRDDLLDRIVQMTDQGHAARFHYLYRLWHRLLPRERREYAQKLRPVDAMDWQFVEESAPLTGPGGILAWDLARMAFLIRQGFLCHWISEPEWDYLHLQLGYRARSAYPDWRYYTNGYLLGRIYWLAQREEISQATRDQLFLAHHHLWMKGFCRTYFSHPENPVNLVPWDLELPSMTKPASLEMIPWS